MAHLDDISFSTEFTQAGFFPLFSMTFSWAQMPAADIIKTSRLMLIADNTFLMFPD